MSKTRFFKNETFGFAIMDETKDELLIKLYEIDTERVVAMDIPKHMLNAFIVIGDFEECNYIEVPGQYIRYYDYTRGEDVSLAYPINAIKDVKKELLNIIGDPLKRLDVYSGNEQIDIEELDYVEAVDADEYFSGMLKE